MDASPLQAEVRVVGQQRIKGQLEEAVHRASSGVDGCNAGGSQHDVFLLGVLADITQKGRLTRACFSGEKNRLAGILNQVQGILKFGVMGVYVAHTVVLF